MSEFGRISLLLEFVIAAAFAISCEGERTAVDGPQPVRALASPSAKEPTADASELPPSPEEVVAEMYRITTRYEDGDPNKIYVPKDLEDCFRDLSEMLHPKFIEKLKAGEDEAINQHFGLGLWIRNNWGLWAGSRLAVYFREIGIGHPDDMSGIILTSYLRHLNNRPIELEAQIKFYQDYWRRVSTPKRRGVTVRGSKNWNK